MRSLPTIYSALLLCIATTLTVEGQQLKAPVPGFNFACVQDNFNTYTAEITFSGSTYKVDNVFYLELSDKNGNFDTPVVLKSISDKNFAFSFDASFAMPTSVYGDNYKLRVRTTSPAGVSEPSVAFNAYYVPDASVVLNNYADINTCSDKVTLTVNNDIAEKYVWYKNGQVYSIAGKSIDITTQGEYYVEPFFGECTGNIYSNIVVVNFLQGFDVSIASESELVLCPGSSFSFHSNYIDDDGTYTWYFNNSPIQGLDSGATAYTFTAGDNSYGTYYLKVNNRNGCEIVSDPVVISKPENGVSVQATSATSAFLFGEEGATLSISTNVANPVVKWYNGQGECIVAFNDKLSVIVNNAGKYYAEVYLESACGALTRSPEFVVNKAEALEARIDFSNGYIPCESFDAEITVASLAAIAADGSKIVIPEAEYAKFQFVWFKDSEKVASSKEAYPADSYNNNGEYRLEVSRGDLVVSSNTISLSLGLPQISLNITDDVVCAGATTSLSATFVKDALYTWYKNNTPIGETIENNFTAEGPGNYSVDVNLLGCSRASEVNSIAEFNEGMVSISPSSIVEIKPNGRQLFQASGAETYLWKDSLGNILSSSDTFEATEEGEYILEAHNGGCYIIKEVKLTVAEIIAIPNVVSPNNDNINDKWILPAKLSNDPSVEVVICDSYGKSVFRAKGYQNNWPNDNVSKELNTSIYYYFITKDGKAIKKGSITLVN